MANSDLSPLEAALESLRKEEEKLAADLEQVTARKVELEERIGQVREAMGPIQKLISGTRPKLVLRPVPGESYAELPISEAIAKLLKVKDKPMTVPEIAVELVARGFKPNTDNFKNLVGVTVRRFEGKRFQRDEENRWRLAA